MEDDASHTSPRGLDQENGKFEEERSGKSSLFRNNVVTEQKKYFSGSLLPDNVLFSKNNAVDPDR